MEQLKSLKFIIIYVNSYVHCTYVATHVNAINTTIKQDIFTDAQFCKPWIFALEGSFPNQKFTTNSTYVSDYQEFCTIFCIMQLVLYYRSLACG